MIDKKCPECGALLKKKDLTTNICWRCKTEGVGEIFKLEEEIERKKTDDIKKKKLETERKKVEDKIRISGEKKKKVEDKNREKKTLSQMYAFLKIFQMFIILSIFIYSFIFFGYQIGTLIDISEKLDNYTSLAIAVFSYMLFLFNSICIT